MGVNNMNSIKVVLSQTLLAVLDACTTIIHRTIIIACIWMYDPVYISIQCTLPIVINTLYVKGCIRTQRDQCCNRASVIFYTYRYYFNCLT